LIGRSETTHVFMAARGTSKNAARYAQYVWGSEAGVLVNIARPLLFQSGPGPRLTGSVVVGISQSGQSPDVINVLNAALDQGQATIAFTNDVDSPLADVADVVVPLLAGVELAVPSTKTLLTCLQTVMQVAEALKPDPVRSSWIDQIPHFVDDAIRSAFEQRDVLTAEGDCAALTVLGRGTGYAAASELALKIREVTAMRAESFSAPEFLHGPIGASREGSLVWVIASPDQPEAYWADLVESLRQRGCLVTALQPSSFARTARSVIELPDQLPAWMFAILATVYGQVASLLIGEKAGLDVDSPKGLSKITITT
jgi:glucosamine--fructose-6-phosphate aminotransferase (isomerizing)